MWADEYQILWIFKICKKNMYENKWFVTIRNNKVIFKNLNFCSRPSCTNFLSYFIFFFVLYFFFCYNFSLFFLNSHFQTHVRKKNNSYKWNARFFLNKNLLQHIVHWNALWPVVKQTHIDIMHFIWRRFGAVYFHSTNSYLYRCAYSRFTSYSMQIYFENNAMKYLKMHGFW